MDRGAGQPRAPGLIRPADPDEFTKVASLLAVAFGDKLSRAAVEAFSQLSEEVRQLAFLADVEGMAVGCVSAEIAEDVIIYNLAVLPEYRCRGIGAALVRCAMALIDREYSPVWYYIAVHPKRREGEARFHSLGFRYVKTVQGYRLMKRRGPGRRSAA